MSDGGAGRLRTQRGLVERVTLCALTDPLALLRSRSPSANAKGSLLVRLDRSSLPLFRFDIIIKPASLHPHTLHCVDRSKQAATGRQKDESSISREVIERDSCNDECKPFLPHFSLETTTHELADLRGMPYA